MTLGMRCDFDSVYADMMVANPIKGGWNATSRRYLCFIAFRFDSSCQASITLLRKRVNWLAYYTSVVGLVVGFAGKMVCAFTLSVRWWQSGHWKSASCFVL